MKGYPKLLKAQIMNFLKSEEPKQKRLRKYILIITFFWSLIIALSLTQSIRHEVLEIKLIAENTARFNFLKDQAFHAWNAGHSGIYVPVTERTQPNPNLAHLPDRDIEKPDGTKLTLMNPAYMLRQLMEDVSGIYGIQGKLTSLNLFYGSNKPDEWETQALKSFEQGATEVIEYTEIDGQPYLRVMHPMLIQENCLKCHAAQGYQIGDVRGGLGVYLPLQSLYDIGRQHALTSIAGYLSIWLLGLWTITFFTVRQSIYLEEQEKTQQALRESEDHLSKIRIAANDGIWDWDLKTNNVHFDARYYEMAGYEKDEFPHRLEEFQNRVHPNDIDFVMDQAQKHLNGENDRFNEEFRFQRKNGGWLWVLAKGIIVERDEKNAPLRFIGTHTDITELKQAEASLRKSESRYKAIIDAQADIIFRFSLENKITFVNDAFSRFYGKTPEQALGFPYLTFAPAHVHEIVQTQFNSLDTETPIMLNENINIDAQGQPHWIQWANQAIFNDNGEIIEYQAVGRDITERVEAETEIKSQRERLSSIIKGTNVGTWEWNLQTGEIIYNEQWANIIGYTLEEISPISIETWLKYTHSEDAKKSNALLEKHIKGELDYYHIESRMKHKDGHWVWILDRGKVESWTEDGKPLWMFGTHQDITERKQAEELVKASLQEKTILLKEIHHRVKNNLAIISSLLSFQADITPGEVARIAFQESQNRIQAMANIHEHLYRSSDLAEIDMAHYIQSVVNHLLWSFGSQSVDIQVNVEDIKLDIDTATPCGLIINELISNAFEHAFPPGWNTADTHFPAGGLSPEGKLHPREESLPGGENVPLGESSQTGRVPQVRLSMRLLADQLELKVSDNGIGLPKDFHIENIGSESLGLYLVNILSQQLEGALEISSSGGTTFCLTFPR